jgi:hypothetical protein
MLFEALVKLDTPFGGGFHEMNPSARRFRLQPQRAISRALVQAKTAMDTVIELGKIQSRDLRTVGLLLFR